MDVLLFLLTFPLAIFFLVLFAYIAYSFLKGLVEVIIVELKKRRYRKWIR